MAEAGPTGAYLSSQHLEVEAGRPGVQASLSYVINCKPITATRDPLSKQSQNKIQLCFLTYVSCQPLL